MASYRFRLFRNGKFLREADHEHPDDVAALGRAETLSAEFEVQVLCGSRFIAQVKKVHSELAEEDKVSQELGPRSSARG